MSKDGRRSKSEVYLENDLVGLGDECGAFELATCNDLRLDNTFLLTNSSLFHVLFLKHG